MILKTCCHEPPKLCASEVACLANASYLLLFWLARPLLRSRYGCFPDYPLSFFFTHWIQRGAVFINLSDDLDLGADQIEPVGGDEYSHDDPDEQGGTARECFPAEARAAANHDDGRVEEVESSA